MSWNGHPVIDLDSHIVERADRFYRDYLDPAYHDAYQQLCDAVARQAQGDVPVAVEFELRVAAAPWEA